MLEPMNVRVAHLSPGAPGFPAEVRTATTEENLKQLPAVRSKPFRMRGLDDDYAETELPLRRLRINTMQGWRGVLACRSRLS